jgi:diguanylate cyclase (GGDEF)-like protein
MEIRCLANDDPECRFILAAPTHLAQHGYRTEDTGHRSVRETLLRLNRQLEDVLEAAQRDPLTGLYNRAHFESALRQRIEHANRRTDTLAVAMIDIDGFKEVNDTQGHGMGDLALRQVGRLLAGQARDTDTVARYGGDEFAWLMPGTSVETALAVADRIRRLAQDLREEMDLPISLSVGIAACPQDAARMADLIDFADAAMYVAKDAGGNQVRRYVAAEDHRSASQKRVRKPRPRGGASTPVKPPPSSQGEALQLNLPDDPLSG